MAIVSFRDPQLKVFIETGSLPKKSQWQTARKITLRKLDMLNYAKDLNDLTRPPGNRLEPLRGDLYGYYSIRINDQWRIIFRWTTKGPSEVEIVDYHF
ncbi:MAG: type II toxin-antitoxin system RelE/ParE family toxin [Rhizobacter sp.]|nr:type II toxin-antitoxin system RelE/ParE family toxin [Bacteriovorax sp.]